MNKWTCKKCGGEMVAQHVWMTGYRERMDVEIPKDKNTERIVENAKINSKDEIWNVMQSWCDLLGYQCSLCKVESKDLEEIAEWKEEA